MPSPLLLAAPVVAAVPPALLLLALSLVVRPRPVKIPIKGRHVFVTGGSQGIGLAIARQAAAAGAARVSILARDRAKLDAAREEIIRAAKNAGNAAVEVGVCSADVRDEAAVRRAVEDAGTIDVLVCNQGVFLPCELEKQDMEEVKFTMDVNVMGNFHLIKAALPGMKAGGAAAGPRSIAIISSQAGQVGIYGYAAYSASKFALRGMAESLQHELINDNIHISLVFPPDTETPGLTTELDRRPELTDIITNSSSGMKADDVAKRTLNGIKSGSFIISCNLEGFMLSLATAGLSPQRSWLMAFAEVIGAGFMRFAGLCFQCGWFDAIEKYRAKVKRS